MTIKETIASRLKTLRKDKGYKQREVAQKICVSVKTYQAWEHKVNEPTVTMLIRLANVYEVTVNDILY